MKTSGILMGALSAALLLSFPARGTAQTENLQPSNYYLSPNTAEPGKPFVMAALNPDLYCTLIYYGQSVSVNGNTISLQFQDSVRTGGPAITCIRGVFGPSFDIPALAAGVYYVSVSQVPTCPVGMMCPMAIIPQYAGRLTVQENATAIPFRPQAAGTAKASADARFRIDGRRWEAAGKRPVFFELSR